MTIPLIIIYYAYLLAVLFFIIFSLINIYHLLKFGFASLTNILVIIAYIIIASLFLIVSLNQLNQIDWQQPLIDLSADNQGPFF